MKGPIQRQMLKQTGVVKNKHLAKQYVEFNNSLGYTPPHLNNLIVQPSTSALEFTAALKPPTVAVNQLSEKEFAATVTDVPTNYVGYMMYLPMPGPWIAHATDIPKTIGFLGLDKTLGLEEVNQLNVRITGLKGNDQTLEQQVKKHEEVHAEDIIRLINNIFVPWDQKLTKAKEEQTAYVGATAEEARSKLYEAVGGTPEEIATKFFVAAENASREFHKSEKGKTNPLQPSIQQIGVNSYTVTAGFYLTI